MKTKRAQSAFTLLELLTVIAIIGILAAIAVPNLGKFKPSVMSAATRQILDDVARARQLAMSQRTTVYMVFVPRGFWVNPGALTTDEEGLLDKQLGAYNFVTLRSLGDQPGAPTVRYLGEWKTLPDGAFIVTNKFDFKLPTAPWPEPPAIPWVVTQKGEQLPFYPFRWTQSIPFPRAESPTGRWLPYIAFNYMGQLVDDQGQVTARNENIPLALGSISYSRNQATRRALAAAPSVTETPIGNATNSFNVINIDWLTGRARVERLEVK